jgi:hypothetical protein
VLVIYKISFRLSIISSAWKNKKAEPKIDSALLFYIMVLNCIFMFYFLLEVSDKVVTELAGIFNGAGLL